MIEASGDGTMSNRVRDLGFGGLEMTLMLDGSRVKAGEMEIGDKSY